MECIVLILHLYRNIQLGGEAKDLLYTVSYPNNPRRVHKRLDRCGMPVLSGDVKVDFRILHHTDLLNRN